LKIRFDSDEGLIRPIKRKTDPELGPDVLMLMIPSDLDYLVKRSQARKLPPSGAGFYDIYRANNGLKGHLTLSGPFIGAPQAVMGMEKMIALGAKRIWVLGCCGSLQEDLRIGDLVIPTRAISEEGTSQHYPIGDKIPATDEKLNEMIEKALGKMGQSFQRGTVWTTDAPYRETPAKVKKYKESGVLAVEMEMSALMALATYRTIKLAGLLVVSDELFRMKWHSGFSNPQLKKSSRFAGEILLSLVGD